jgi:hypothetical protein
MILNYTVGKPLPRMQVTPEDEEDEAEDEAFLEDKLRHAPDMLEKLRAMIKRVDDNPTIY